MAWGELVSVIGSDLRVGLLLGWLGVVDGLYVCRKTCGCISYISSSCS